MRRHIWGDSGQWLVDTTREIYEKENRPASTVDFVRLRNTRAVGYIHAHRHRLHCIGIGTGRRYSYIYYYPENVVVPSAILTNPVKVSPILREASDEYVLKRLREVMTEFYRRDLSMKQLVAVSENDARP